MELNAGSGPGKGDYIHIHYMQGSVVRQKMNKECTRVS